MNPARSFAPAIYNWNWENQWIYWVAPTTASLAATLIFRFGFYKAEEKPNEVFITNIISDDKNKEEI